jgi:hypothetical protein
MLGTGCLGLLSMGMPMMIVASGVGGADDLAGLLAALVLFRGPVLMLATALRPILLRHLALGGLRRPPALRMLAAGLASGLGVVVAAWMLGPPILHLALGEAFRTSPEQAAMLAGSGVLLAAMSVTGTVLVVRQGHQSELAGWTAALIVTATLLWAPAPFELRTTLALVVGPLVGLLVHGGALWRRSRVAM